jgi:hypothetical protein
MKKTRDSVNKPLLTAVDIDEGQIRVTNSTGSRICDGLILTMPVPQILSLKGNISVLIGLLTESLVFFIITVSVFWVIVFN